MQTFCGTEKNKIKLNNLFSSRLCQAFLSWHPPPHLPPSPPRICATLFPAMLSSLFHSHRGHQGTTEDRVKRVIRRPRSASYAGQMASATLGTLITNVVLLFKGSHVPGINAGESNKHGNRKFLRLQSCTMDFCSYKDHGYWECF